MESILLARRTRRATLAREAGRTAAWIADNINAIKWANRPALSSEFFAKAAPREAELGRRPSGPRRQIASGLAEGGVVSTACE